MERLPSPSETQPLLGTQNFNLDNPYPNLLSSEIEAKINVFCVHCRALELRNWQGKIIGNGLHASLTALYARIKHGFTFYTASIPLIGLWTVCLECCVELGLDREEDQMKIIFNYKHVNRIVQEIVVKILYKEVEEIISSKVFIKKSELFSAYKIETAGKDGQRRVWPLWKPPKPIFNDGQLTYYYES
jgi:hypothetical protein